jgi:hypothetical protein
MKCVPLLHVALTCALAAPLAAAQAALHTVQGAALPAGAGGALVFVADVDGDGVRDFAVGSPLEAPAGVVRVHSGADGSVLRTFGGATPGASFGAALAVVTDLDGGGLPDLMVGAPDTTWSHASQGTAYVYSLETGLRWIQLFGGGANARMGQAVANLGDVDGDGVEDFGAGEPGADFAGLVDNGAVTVVSGATLAFVATLRGVESGEQFGFALGAWGDLDGDGDDEWLCGAPFHSSMGVGGGRVALLAGGSNSVLSSIYGGHANEHFGMALLGLGDTDGDGVLDFAVGAPDHSAGAANRGRVARFSGLSPAPSEELLGQLGERLGRSLARVDWDGDGAFELAAGAPNHVAGSAGRVGAVHRLDARTLAPLATLPGRQIDSEFGGALANGADLNGDGAQELLVGARSESANRGVARVLLGNGAPAQSYCSAKPTSAGCTPRIDGVGAASLTTGGGLRVVANGVTQNAPGMLFFGFAPNSAPFHGGTLCVAQPIRRTPVQLSSVGAAGCSGSLTYVFTPGALAGYGLAAGANVHAQFWWRDSGFAAPNNIGLSDALRFTVAP